MNDVAAKIEKALADSGELGGGGLAIGKKRGISIEPIPSRPGSLGKRLAKIIEECRKFEELPCPKAGPRNRRRCKEYSLPRVER
jgi:hypothetical protein